MFTNQFSTIYSLRTHYFSFVQKKCHFGKNFIFDFPMTNFALEKRGKTHGQSELISFCGKPPSFEENSKFKKKYFSNISSVNLNKKYFFSELFCKNQILSEIFGNEFFPLCTVFRIIKNLRKRYSEKMFVFIIFTFFFEFGMFFKIKGFSSKGN